MKQMARKIHELKAQLKVARDAAAETSRDIVEDAAARTSRARMDQVPTTGLEAHTGLRTRYLAYDR